MHRRDFIKNTCTVCIGMSGIAAILTSCSPSQYITGTIGKEGLNVDVEDFVIKERKNKSYHQFVIVRNEALLFPICVYRHSEKDYSALWMRCSHQGAELQASGDQLQCPAHGSEFNSRGNVTNGPADTALKTFPVTINNNQLFIDLKKQ